MPVQLKDEKLEKFLEEEGDRRGRLSKAAALRMIVAEAIHRREDTKLPPEHKRANGEHKKSN